MNPTVENFGRYAAALFSVIAAFLLRIAIEALVGQGLPAFVTFYPAIMYIALKKGLGPGLFATTTSVIVVDCFIITPYILGHWTLREAASLLLFAGMGVFMTFVAHRYRLIQGRLEILVADRTSELSRTNAVLEKQIEEHHRLITNHKQAEELLQQTNVKLESEVAERTRHLLEIIDALQIEMVKHQQAEKELRRQEHLLTQQSRHAAMGEMIGNIAHQWRQPLNTLGLFTQRLGVFYGSPSFNKEFLETSVAKSMEIIQYMSRTIDDFRNFFSAEREKSEFKVDEAVRKALSLVEASFKERSIKIEKQQKEDVIITGYPNEYAQVLLNLCINAKDAMCERNIESPWLKITVDTENGASLVTIADNAGGIPEDVMDRIFDPYFTTKGPQQGTGVGLFMSKAIIENNMGGRLTVRNTDVGAEFRIEV